MKKIDIYFLLFLLIVACVNNNEVVDYSHIPEAFTVNISIPAGETEHGIFLPLPGNLSYLDAKESVQVLTLTTALKKGSTLTVRPLGTLILKDNNLTKSIIIASPIDSTLQLSKTTNFQEFIATNAGEKQIIQDWFLYRKGLGKVELVGWKDEKFALSLIEK